MLNQLTCSQVCALLPFYAEDKLSQKLSQAVWQHLQNCSACMEKFNKIKNIFNKFVEIPDETCENQFATKQYENFKSNLSAYIDNELDDTDSIKIKKIAISNPLARQDLENIYQFKKLLHSSFEKTKNELKNDFTKSVLLELQSQTKTDPFIKLSILFCAMITLIIVGVVAFLYF